MFSTTQSHKLIMFKEVFNEMFHPSKAAILSSLKRSNGLPVSDVANEVEMSYMGVKQHCINLERMGFLESWKVPRKEVGRPEKLYRLTDKCDDLFPTAGLSVTLEFLRDADDLFGEGAAHKMLERYFAQKTAFYASKLPDESPAGERVMLLSDLRENEGYFNNIISDEGGNLTIQQFHNPMEALALEYPIARELEHKMLESLIGTTLEVLQETGPHGQAQFSYLLRKVA